MRYEVLGPLRVTAGATVLTVNAPKVATLLTALVVRANTVVSKEALITELWDGSPPRRASAGLHVYVSQLRKLLARAAPGPSPIVTEHPGYLLAVDPADTDWGELERLTRLARAARAGGDLEESSRALARAVALWRGPLPDPRRHGPLIGVFAAWARTRRLQCLEDHVEVGLALDRHRSLIGLLSALVAEHPLHEAFHAQLMRALYASERRAEALWAYRRAETTLRRELGLGPGRQLREVHRAIVAGEPVPGPHPCVAGADTRP
ncbi:BTAD domain-containing putative transcriptional regulator [Kitasatospora sp. NPDC057965]|uniref:AfsR/SARP family transcriptional regulator n=1 Tax=unclassified Kitasatospora TaxID=2633591 RepID=UPI0036C26E2D